MNDTAMTNLMMRGFDVNLNLSTKDNWRSEALVTLITKRSSPLRLAVALPWLAASSMKTARIQLALVTKFPTPARLRTTPETVTRWLSQFPVSWISDLPVKLWTTVSRICKIFNRIKTYEHSPGTLQVPCTGSQPVLQIAERNEILVQQQPLKYQHNQLTYSRCCTLYQPFSSKVLSVLTTLHQPVSQRFPLQPAIHTLFPFSSQV